MPNKELLQVLYVIQAMNNELHMQKVLHTQRKSKIQIDLYVSWEGVAQHKK